MIRLYHPQLGREIEVPDVPACIKAHEESGWRLAPQPETTTPGVAPEPVSYEPVGTKRPKSAKPATN